jgi:hypothetical protein
MIDLAGRIGIRPVKAADLPRFSERSVAVFALA